MKPSIKRRTNQSMVYTYLASYKGFLTKNVPYPYVTFSGIDENIFGGACGGGTRLEKILEFALLNFT